MNQLATGECLGTLELLLIHGHKELLEHLGESCTGRVREIYQGAQSNIDEPKNLEKIIVS